MAPQPLATPQPARSRVWAAPHQFHCLSPSELVAGRRLDLRQLLGFEPPPAHLSPTSRDNTHFYFLRHHLLLLPVLFLYLLLLLYHLCRTSIAILANTTITTFSTLLVYFDLFSTIIYYYIIFFSPRPRHPTSSPTRATTITTQTK